MNVSASAGVHAAHVCASRRPLQQQRQLLHSRAKRPRRAPLPMSGADREHRLAPAASMGEANGSSAALSVQSFKEALSVALEAASTAKQAAETAQRAAAAAEEAAERTARLLSLALNAGVSTVADPAGLPSRSTPSYGRDTRVLPRRIILVRHGESQVRALSVHLAIVLSACVCWEAYPRG